MPQNVSLVDLLPTLHTLAGGDPDYIIKPIDGRSLIGLLEGESDSWSNCIMAEYLGDGTPAPCLMIRENRYKFIFCEPDPPLLFDLKADPRELNNLAAKSDYTQIVEKFEKGIRKRWDIASLTRDIIMSQRQRLLVEHAHTKGRSPVWDFATNNNPLARYMRRHEFWQVTEERARLPRPEFMGTCNVQKAGQNDVE